MPLFAPREQNWSEEPLPINSNNIYQLLTSPGNKTLDELVKDPSVPILAFTGTLLQEIRYITNKLSNSEYAVFLALRRIDKNHPHFLAYDFFMPEQKASGGGVALDPKDCQRHFDGLKTHPYYKENGLHRHLCHLHSHAGMNVFWSATDDTQQLSRDDLGFMDDYRFYCVVNTKEEIKCSFVFYKPVLARVDGAVAVSFSGPEHAEQLTRKRRKELDEMIAATISGYGANTVRASEFGTAVEQTAVTVLNNSKEHPFCYGGDGARQGNFRGGWGNKQYGDRFPRRAAGSFGGYSGYNAGKCPADVYDEYWDSFHGRNNAGYGWNGNEQDVDEIWDSKNWADSANQPINLGWFAFLDDYKRMSKISDAMLQEFLSSANVDRKYAKRARTLLSWVIDRVFQLGENMDNPVLTPEQDAFLGTFIGEYVQEFMHTLRENLGPMEDWDDKMYLAEDTCLAIRSGNKERIIEAVITDLADTIIDELSAL